MKRWMRFSNWNKSKSWHSQIIIVRHPLRRSFAIALRSLISFILSFVLQNPTRDFGIRSPSAHECRCQKHPWTKMTRRSLMKTRSGVPGRSRL